MVTLKRNSGDHSDINTYGDSHGRANPLPLNNTRNQSDNTQSYKNTTSAESTQYQYFEDSLTCCCLFDLLAEQAVKEFEDEFKKNPPPIYFEWWRNCWDEYEITHEMVREWLERCDRLGWSERLGGAA